MKKSLILGITNFLTSLIVYSAIYSFLGLGIIFLVGVLSLGSGYKFYSGAITVVLAVSFLVLLAFLILGNKEKPHATLYSLFFAFSTTSIFRAMLPVFNSVNIDIGTHSAMTVGYAAIATFISYTLFTSVLTFKNTNSNLIPLICWYCTVLIGGYSALLIPSLWPNITYQWQYIPALAIIVFSIPLIIIFGRKKKISN